MLKIIIIFFAIITSSTKASIKGAEESLKDSKNKDRFILVAKELIDAKLYFSAIPYINLQLEQYNKMDSELEKMIETLVYHTGTMAVLNLDEARLEQFDIPSVQFILGIRLFHQNNLEKSEKILEKINSNHYFYSESSLTLGTIHVINGQFDKAEKNYQNCLSTIDTQIDEKNKTNTKLSKYLENIKETCQIHLARIQIKQKNYKKALEIYQLVDKRSYKWPYILKEKAWANYYLKDYNKSLGLLVTYKSPLLSSYFFPEAEVLTALNYYNLCLWDDAMLVVDQFYEVYKKRSDLLKEMLIKNRQSHDYFFELVYGDLEDKSKENPFIRNLIIQTKKQVKFNLDLHSYLMAKEEIAKINRLKNPTAFSNKLTKELEETIQFIRKRMNSYIKKEFFNFINETHKISYDMFNLKLELLFQKRSDIYRNELTYETRSRGSLSSVERKSDQYLFDFNGSFWADELGDYTFGLESRCQRKD